MARSRRVVVGVVSVAAVVALAEAGCGPFQYHDGPGQVAGAGGGNGGAGGGTGGSATGGAGGEAGGGIGGGGGAGAGGGRVCDPGEVVFCVYNGPANTEGIGACKAGQRVCNEEGTAFGPCEGEVQPGPEIPGAVDEDCDGTALMGGNSVVVRYFINEDPALNPGSILDAAQPPLNLTILNPNPQDPVLSIAEEPVGYRGLRWVMSGTSARASVLIEGTKAQTSLNQMEAATFEIVADLDAAIDWTRLIFIGHIEGINDGIDDYSLLLKDNRLHLYLDDQSKGQWDYDPSQAERVVLHLVLNTAEATAEERRKLYVNGQMMPSANSSGPSQNQLINLSASTYLSLGTRIDGNFSPQGVMYYAAIYSTALNDDEVQSNAALLLLDDDNP